MLLCLLFGVVGSLAYFFAGVPKMYALALAGRFVQGLWTGGQQTVEQAFLSENTTGEERTALSATLGSYAVAGFVLGPAFGAALSGVNVHAWGYLINGVSAPAALVCVAACDGPRARARAAPAVASHHPARTHTRPPLSRRHPSRSLRSASGPSTRQPAAPPPTARRPAAAQRRRPSG